MNLRKTFDESVKFGRGMIEAALGDQIGKRIFEGVEKGPKPRDKNFFENILDRLPGEGAHGVRAARNIRAWHRRLQHRIRATYRHPRTGEWFEYGPFYEDAAVEALNSYLESLPNDQERVKYMLRFGGKNDEGRDDVIHGLTGDRFFQLLDAGRDAVNRTAERVARDVVRPLANAMGPMPANPSWHLPWPVMILIGVAIVGLILMATHI